MYRNFTNALIVEVANAFALLVIPTAVLVYCHLFFRSYIMIVSPLMLGIAGLFPLVSQCFMLVYIQPYRK
uniref:SSD domain-containing protein n=1 Tax=Acrobeloides nanus TaxID=290746 RepID=A0A914CDP1_9BILA